MRRKVFTPEYKRQCFDIWYLNGRPNLSVRVLELIPEDERGFKPSAQTIKLWLDQEWNIQADELDVQVQTKADELVIDAKIEVLKKHQEQAVQVQAKALEYLLSEGFDSSASAVQALFRGMEEERKTLGFSDLLEKLETMSNNQVRDQIINLINRATENNQIVEEGSEVVGLLEEDTIEGE